MLIRIAWRNIWRHRTRSAAVIASVASGLWAGLFLMAYVFGLSEQRVNTAIETEIAHLQVHHPALKPDYAARHIIPEGVALAATLARDPRVKAVAGRTLAPAMAATATGSAGIMVNGVSPEIENRVSKLNGKIRSGTGFQPGKKNQALVGEKLAQKLNLDLGAKLVVTLLDSADNLVSGAFRIAGIYKTDNTPYDETNLFVQIQDLNALLALDSSINEIAILLAANDDLPGFETGLRAGPAAGLAVENWMEIAPEIGLLVTYADQAMYIFMIIILFALAFGIINTMLMAVLERTRELGMLMALGMNRLKVFWMIVLETFFLVLAGCPLGFLLTYGSVAWFGRRGIDLSQYSDAYSSFGYGSVVYPELEARHYFSMLLLVGLTALASALIPARRALALQPAEAIRK